MNTARRQPCDDIAIVPRLSTSETAMLVAALETRARVYEQSARTLSGNSSGSAVIVAMVERDKSAAASCRALAERLNKLTRTMKGNRG